MIPTVDWDSPTEKLDEIFDLEIEKVFRYTKQPATLTTKLLQKLPKEITVGGQPKIVTAITFVHVTPGSPYYTSYGDNTIIIAARTVEDAPSNP